MKEEPAAPGAALAAAAFACVAAATAWFARAETTPPSFDEAWYLEVSFRLFHALRNHGPAAFAREYAGAFRFKAPLAAVLPLPLYFLHGPSYRAAILMNIPALALIAVSLYGLGRRFFSPAAGGLAAAFALTMPLTAALSHTFFVETWLTALVAAFLWRLAASDQLRRPSEPPRLGALLGLGFLAKVLFPLPLLGPLATTLWERRGDARGPDWAALERPLKVLAAVAAPIALTWYAPNLLYVVGYMFQASVGGIASHYGSSHVFLPSVFLPFWETLAREGTSYFVLLAAAGSAWFLGRRLWEEPGLRFAAAWAAVPFAVVSFGVGKDPRFFAPALPGAALFLGGALDLATRGRRWRALLLAAALFPPLDLLALQTCGRGLIPPLRLGPLGLVVERTRYGGEPRRLGGFGQEELVRALAREIGGPAVVALGAEHAFLNANLLAAWAARDDLPLSFVHYGHMEDRVERTVARLSEKEAGYILFIDGLDPSELPAMVPAVDGALRGLIARGKLPFRLVRRFRLAPGSGLSAELWERTGSVRMTGAR